MTGDGNVRVELGDGTVVRIDDSHDGVVLGLRDTERATPGRRRTEFVLTPDVARFIASTLEKAADRAEGAEPR